MAIIETDTRKQNQLVRDFDEQLDIRKNNRLELGRIARKLKALHESRGERERGKGWKAFLEERNLSRRTVDDWILDYERSIGARASQSVVAESATTNSDNKGLNRPEPLEIEENVIDSIPQPKLYVCPTSEPAPPSSRMDSITSKDISKPEGRSNLLFKTAVNLYGNTGDHQKALAEWDAVAARVRNYLVAIQITPEEKVNHSRRQYVDGLE